MQALPIAFPFFYTRSRNHQLVQEEPSATRIRIDSSRSSSEMFSDSMVDLVNKGCITNNQKTMYRGWIVGSFCVGLEKLYMDFMDNNTFIKMLVVDYVNDPKIVCK